MLDTAYMWVKYPLKQAFSGAIKVVDFVTFDPGILDTARSGTMVFTNIFRFSQFYNPNRKGVISTAENLNGTDIMTLTLLLKMIKARVIVFHKHASFRSSLPLQQESSV